MRKKMKTDKEQPKKKNMNVGADQTLDPMGGQPDGAAENPQQKNGEALLAMVFEHSRGGLVRVLPGSDGEPLICCKDVCQALGYRNVSEPMRKYVEKSHLVVRNVLALGAARADGRYPRHSRQMLFVDEEGFRQFVEGCPLRWAQEFADWVMDVLLPGIRQGGYCEAPCLRMEVDQRNRIIAEQDSRIGELDRQIGEQVVKIARTEQAVLDLEGDVDRLLPRALYADNVLDSLSCYTTTQVAKELGVTAQELNRQLCALRIQYYQSGQYMLYAEYAHMGLAKSRTFLRLEERMYSATYLVWTERGRKFIHDRVRGEA